MYIITQLICYVEWVFDVSNHACTQDTNETYRDVNEIALVIHPLKIIQISIILSGCISSAISMALFTSL